MPVVPLTNTHDKTRRRKAVANILGDAQASRFVIQDFRPLAGSVEWKLGLLDYENGSQAFGGDRPIPSAINNDGNFSLDAAEIFFQGLQAADDNGTLPSQFRVLELGPGLGLFARYFLDAFRDLCREKEKAKQKEANKRGRESFIDNGLSVSYGLASCRDADDLPAEVSCTTC